MDQAWIEPSDGRIRLQPGTVIGGEIVIEGELGAGGFGITYRGRDRALGRALAVKEYFPLDVGHRARSMSVHPATESTAEIFRWGLDNFIKEAKILAGLKHPGIVSVFRYFTENDTAYMVLDFVEGKPMGRWLDSLGRPPTQTELDNITLALCNVLETVHANDIVHRDIAPDNIIIRSDGQPVLLDFGAARQDLAVARRDQSRLGHSASFAIVKRSYSPVEAFANDKASRGPWSDIYSLGATLYRAVTGKAPPDSMDRLASGDEHMTPAVEAGRGRYRPSLLHAIDRALALRRQERVQSAIEFRTLAFSNEATQVHAQTLLSPGLAERTVLPNPRSRPEDLNPTLRPAGHQGLPGTGGWSEIAPPPQAPPRRSAAPIVAAVVALLVVLAGGTGAYLSGWSGFDFMFPGQRIERERVASFARQRQDVEGVVSRLRTAVDEVRQAGDARDWNRMRNSLTGAQTTMEQARSGLSRLRQLSVTSTELGIADALQRDVEALNQRVTTMSQTLADGEAATRRQQAERELQIRQQQQQQQRPQQQRPEVPQGIDRDVEDKLSSIEQIITNETEAERQQRERAVQRPVQAPTQPGDLQRQPDRR